MRLYSWLRRTVLLCLLSLSCMVLLAQCTAPRQQPTQNAEQRHETTPPPEEQLELFNRFLDYA
jgi:hypothetical protein